MSGTIRLPVGPGREPDPTKRRERDRERHKRNGAARKAGEPARQHRKLPVVVDDGRPVGHFADGSGERHDCGRYSKCLDAFRGNGDAHCPSTCPACNGYDDTCAHCHGTGCRWHEVPAATRATEHMGSGRSTTEASIYASW